MDTIKMDKDKWSNIACVVGLGYYVMHYESVEGFSEAVDKDKRAVELFTKAQKSMTELWEYLNLSEH